MAVDFKTAENSKALNRIYKEIYPVQDVAYPEPRRYHIKEPVVRRNKSDRRRNRQERWR